MTTSPITTETIPIADLVLLDTLQARCTMNAEIVDEYAKLYEMGTPIPSGDAIRVTDGEYAGKILVWDGFHRIAGLKKLGQPDFVVDIREGTFADAIDLATAANAGHGLRRTNDDKRRAVTMALTLDKQLKRKRSDRQVAQHVGVHHSTVSEIKAELSGKPKKGTAAKEAVAATEAEQPPADKSNLVEIDELGRRVTDPEVQAALSMTPEFDDIVSELDKIGQRITQLGKLPAGVELAAKVQGLLYDLMGVKNTVKFARPYTTCPFMPNCTDANCATCKSQKWISRQVWELLDQAVRDSAVTGLSVSDAPPADVTMPEPEEVTA